MFVFMPIGSGHALFKWFIHVRYNGFSSKLGCDCAVLFVFQVVVEGVKKREKASQNINHQ